MSDKLQFVGRRLLLLNIRLHFNVSNSKLHDNLRASCESLGKERHSENIRLAQRAVLNLKILRQSLQTVGFNPTHAVCSYFIYYLQRASPRSLRAGEGGLTE